MATGIYTITRQRKFLTTKVTSITVTGLPARYTNFRSLPDSVWADPVFRNCKGGGRGIFGKPATVARKSSKKHSGGLKADKGERQWRKPGFAGHVALTGGLSVYNTAYGSYYHDSDRVDDARECSGDFGLLVDMGWQVNSSLYAGVGSGVIFGDNWDEFGGTDCGYSSSICQFNRVPFYLNARYHFSGEARKSAFADMKIGFTSCPRRNYDMGLFFSPALGYSIGAFDIGLSYTFTNLGHDYEAYGETQETS